MAGEIIKDLHTVFVYGTLKKGQPNEYFMKDVASDISFVGPATTQDAYPLIIGGQWNLPMLINIEGRGKNVNGELYKVNDEALNRLDEFEGHPDFYTRTEINVVCKATSLPLKCWTYFINKYTEEDLSRDFIADYDSYGEHGLAYDTSENDEHPDT